MRLAAYATAWLDTRRVRGRPLALRTQDTYRNSLNKWVLPYVGALEVRQLTTTTVRGWHAEMTSKAEPTAARQAYSLLRPILNTAVDEELLRRNPCRVRGAGQSHSAERPLLDLEAVERLAAAMPPHLRCLVVVAFWAHTRIGEVIALRREDLDLGSGILHVRRQQVEVTGRGPVVVPPIAASACTVYLPEPAVEALHAHLVARGPLLPAAPLFTGLAEGPLRAGQVQWAWRQARRRAGLPDGTFTTCGTRD